MFQYAAGRALSLYKDVPLKLDVSGFLNYELHQGFELSRIFECPTIIANDSDMQEVLGWRKNTLIRRQLLRPRLSNFRPKHLIVEPYFQYWNEFKNITKSCYLHGYWQSEKYFSDVSKIIATDFTFKLPLNEKNKNLLNKILMTEAVSIHVRRGDYLSNPTAAATHGLCSLDYYQSAINHIASKVNAPCFFIFSDDINWARENLDTKNFHSHYIGHNRGSDSYIDMQLMSICKHNIIANSSFSWWGAWLNSNQSKIVIRPKKWFETNRYDTSTLCPEKWISI